MPSLIPLQTILLFLSALPLSTSTSIPEITGPKFLSPLTGQTITNLTGLITAIGPDGLWLRAPASQKSNDPKISNSLYVFGRNLAASGNLTVGDEISLSGKVAEYRSNKDYLYLTELTSPVLTTKISSGNSNAVKPLVLGKQTLSPPTKEFSGLDGGDVFAVPNNVSLVSTANPELQPRKYGLDFWESLSGELVTIEKPVAIAKPNSFGDTWVVGDWRVTGENGRDGLTMRDRDANPEALLIGTPLDTTKNPLNTTLGTTLQPITGVLTYAFGFYRLLPLTALKPIARKQPLLPSVTKLESKGKCDGITFGAYNVENLAPQSDHLGAIAGHIVSYLKSPDMLFLQEVQDDNGPTNDAVTTANLTLTTLTAAIASAGGPNYAFTEIAPVDDQDGGQPGGNIRVAYLYKPSLIRLFKPNPGNSTSANEVLAGTVPTLKYNPGRIDPGNAAWTASRKPLVAQWEVIDSKKKDKKDSEKDLFFTVNVHFASKGGSSSIQGDARPPVNGGVLDRLAQAELTANFVKDILAKDRKAKIITSGDFNEFSFVKPLEQYTKISGLKDLDEVAGIKDEERYTYLFDMNAQQLDHMFVSPAVKKAKYEHIHINTWVEFNAQISDHDPSVARLDVCA